MGDFNRVVVLVDMDCFYCQVEVRLHPEHRGKPLAVVQYNAWRGGGIIAVNYEARDKGVKRGMRGDEARKLCPNIVLCKVAEVRGKADLTKYRDAGREIVDVLHEFTSCIQVASIDESYLDITQTVEERMMQLMEMEGGVQLDKLSSTFVIGYSNDKSNDEGERISGLQNWLKQLSDPNYLRLAVGAMIVEEMRSAVYERTSFRCSAGISYNKPLAKLVCGVHKPNRQTVLPPDKVELFFSTLPLRKMRNLGGKFGTEVVERLGCQTMGDLARFSLRDLQRHYDEKNGTWLYNIAHGIDHEPVTVRLIPKSIGCSKNFPGRTALATKSTVEHWIRELTTELVVRLTEDQENNKRRAQHLTVSVSQDTADGSLASITRSGSLVSYNIDRIVATAILLIAKTNTAAGASPAWIPPIKNISLSAGKFIEDSSSQNKSIQSFFKQITKEDFQSIHPEDVKTSKTLDIDSDTSMKMSTQNTRQVKKNEGEIAISSTENGTFKRNTKKRPSIDQYFLQSDSDSIRDILFDESSIGSNSNEICEAVSGSENKHFSTETEDESQAGSDIPRNEKQNAAYSLSSSVCPDNLDEAVYHSFFARYIVAKRKGRDSLTGYEPLPSTSRESSKASSEVMPCLTAAESSDSDNHSENEENIFEKCDECNELIPLRDFPEHVDYHSALNLQKELNENLSPPDGNAISTNATHNLPNTCNLNDASSGTSGAPIVKKDDESKPPIEKCCYCSKLIPLSEFPEHMDYHSAVNLQKELNKVQVPPVTSSNQQTAPSIKRKKGRPNKQAPSPAKKEKVQSVASFFGLK